jgi:hypothetical protein
MRASVRLLRAAFDHANRVGGAGDDQRDGGFVHLLARGIDDELTPDLGDADGRRSGASSGVSLMWAAAAAPHIASTSVSHVGS